jgi:hypothetical protein
MVTLDVACLGYLPAPENRLKAGQAKTKDDDQRQIMQAAKEANLSETRPGHAPNSLSCFNSVCTT